MTASIARWLIAFGVLGLIYWRAKRRAIDHPDLVSAKWLREHRQGERDEFHGPTVKGPFYREGA